MGGVLHQHRADNPVFGVLCGFSGAAFRAVLARLGSTRGDQPSILACLADTGNKSFHRAPEHKVAGLTVITHESALRDEQ